MDFKYIEQLLQRYFTAETTVQEEQILRTFFSQDEMPESLRRWQPLFKAQETWGNARLDEHFDERILQKVGEHHVRAQRITLRQRLRPLYTAAAFVAFAIVVGTAVEQSTQYDVTDDANPTAPVAQDELDPTETTPLDIRSAEAIETPALLTPSDSLGTAK